MNNAIPVVQVPDFNLNIAHQRIRDRLNLMAGQTRNSQPLDDLPTTATLAEVIARLNAITQRMQS